MTAMAWALMTILCTLYLTCLCTVCVLTFRKGYIVLGIVGIFLPVLWLIGAMLPAKRRSRYAVKHAMHYLRELSRDAGRAETSGTWRIPGIWREQ